MTNPWHLGNDVVDLRHPGGIHKAADERFLARVCSPEEREVIHSSPDPDVALWAHWAGKEAIYKSASKALGAPPVFQHSLFQVAFPEEPLLGFLGNGATRPGTTLSGIGTYGDLSFGISLGGTGSSVHAVSWLRDREGRAPNHRSECREWKDGTRGPATGLDEHFSLMEWDCVTHRASALTRIMARRSIAKAGGLSEADLEIRCGPGPPGRRIPSVWLSGKEIPVDLTLSHHGHFLACAFLAGYLSQGR